MRIGVLAASALPCMIALAAPDLEWQLRPAFSVEPAALLGESRANPAREGQGVLELLEETAITFDTQGRRETRYRYIFRIDHESAIDGWRSVSAVWVPWNQERPRIRARVITPDGKVHVLDETTIGEFPINEEGTSLYDDRKRLAAPLPQLGLGALAEVEILLRETAPAHASGSLVYVDLQQPVPVMRTRVTLDLPETLPLRWALRGLGPVRPQKTAEGGRTRLSLDLGPMEAPEEREHATDPEVQPQPALTFTTVPSWGAAAAGYAAIVERQLAGADLGAWVKEAVGGATSPRAKIDLLLARMNKAIRYTGVEFGEAGIVPRTPAETLRRGFGDCKDKAALLVALLREAGIRAHVALLDTGPGRDIDPGLPGLNHFDHAIVFVPGAAPLWIDPTQPCARAGDLPFPDQGRRALVADAGTQAPALTPVATSTDNLAVETREVFLAESGKGRVVETSHPGGLAEMKLRDDFGPTEPRQLRENLKRYLQGAYECSDLGAFSVGDSADLAQPFVVRLEALDCGMAVTSDIDAAVTLNAWAMSAPLRKLIPTSYDLKDKETPKARKQDLLLSQPYAVEWRYRIVPPLGFRARPLPESGRVAFGPASLARTYSLDPSGIVLATYRFDSGKARWTAQEVEEARKALEAFGHTPPTRVRFDQVGEALLSGGRIKEAIEAFRSQALALPTRGIPQARLAIALLRGGLGDAARAAARKGCELEPASMFCHRALGWVLLHDLVGRPYQDGWDCAGATAAYRKAKELDPKDALSRKNLAILLEHNPQGQRFGPGADLEAALQEYRGLRKELQSEDLNANLLTLLWRTRHDAELLTVARSLPTPREGYSWLLASTARTRGSAEALKEAGTAVADSGQRRAALLAAGDLLAADRLYAEAAALLTAGADGADNAPAIRGRIAVLARTRKFEEAGAGGTDPASAIWRLIHTLAEPSATEKDLAGCLTPELLATSGGAKGLADFRASLGLNSQKRDGTGVSPTVILDVLYALSQVVTEGSDAAGYRIRLHMAGSGESAKDSWYVVRAKTGYQVAAMEEAQATLGIEALRRLERGDLAGTRAMLDRAREIVWAGSKADPLSGHPLCLFWEKGQAATPEQLRAAAASLMAPDKDCAQAVPLLLAARAGQDAERFDLALLSAHRVHSDWAALLPIAERIAKAHPTSTVATEACALSLNGLRRWADLLQVAEAGLAREPENVEFSAFKAKALGMLGRRQEREDLFKAAIASGKATALEYNNLAWSQLAQGVASDQTLDWARRSVMLKGEKNAAGQHTLASILAERGETTEALEIFFKELATLDGAEVRGQDWYLIGRIAEQFGEAGAAAGCYRRVPPLKPDEEADEESCHALAQKRLKALGKG